MTAALSILNNYIRRSRLLTKCMFGVRVPDRKHIHWDFTTIVLKKALSKIAISKHSFLEIGTGPYAILAIYLYRRGNRRIVASDINQDYVRSALKTISGNEASFPVVKSDLFYKIKGKFDIIFFNSVYIPRQKGQDLRLHLIHRSNTHWCGGNVGTETIELFLKGAVVHLNHNGEVFLGFNPYYLPEERICQIARNYRFQVMHRIKSRINPSTVYVLKPDSA